MSSNFFSQQDLARRNTRLLIVLFTLAVVILLLLTNALVVFGLGIADSNQLGINWNWRNIPWPMVSLVSALVVGAVSLAVLLKWQKLRHGGKVVAESLGGMRISADSTEPLHRRLLNVVEEMAIAANVPVPPVYLLPESGINAFAAGYSPADAVIGVTQGCIEQLNRDELQGVIAHEFSHILNGDMRMNIRLIAILNGILFVGHIGYFLLRGSSSASIATRSRSNKKGNAGGIMLVALGLVIIGYVGSFFGNLIKAAVSRQREYLADASAVQFSRNPRGIAGALKMIGSHSSHSRIAHRNADENSHLFFSEAVSKWASVFATHPPLSDRIKRIEPHWNGKFPSPRASQTGDESGSDKQATTGRAGNGLARERLQQALPLLLLHSSRQTQPAMALVCSLLLHDDARQEQLRLIREMGSATLLQQVDQLSDSVDNLNMLQQVQVLQRVIPALKTLSEHQFVQFDQLLQALVNAMPAVNLQQWLVSRFIEHTVATEYSQQHIVGRRHSASVSAARADMLPLLALVSSVAGEQTAITQAWQAGIRQLQLPAETSMPTIDLADLDSHLPALIALPPNVKQQLWQALEHCVQADQQVQLQEKALLLALALLLEVPYNDADINTFDNTSN